MNNELPSSLYKYQAIKNINNLSEDRSIQNLFNRQIIFSSRKNFNDPFDSKIDLIFPTLTEIKMLRKKVVPKQKKEVSSFYNKSNWTKEFSNFSRKIVDMFNKVIDNDRILCLSENGTNNLMWGHYANSHKGFIIEFDTRYLKVPIRIKYTKEIQSLKLMTYIEYYFTKNKILGKQIGKEIMEALGCKLYDWEYEEEYRIILSNEPRKNLLVCDKENYSIIRYPNKPIVKSIIFGCRMPKEVRQYIIDKIPYQVKFKEVIELKSKLKIVDYKGTDLYIK